MQKKKKKLKNPEEFSSDVNMSETCINYSQLKKKYSRETLRVNCNEYCLCSSLNVEKMTAVSDAGSCDASTSV